MDHIKYYRSKWETVIDFTSINRRGVSVGEILESLTIYWCEQDDVWVSVEIPNA